MPLAIVRDDLANMRADAIVLPSNEQLHINGGSSAAVARKAGLLRVRRACRKLGGCSVGSAVSTSAFSFPAKYLIHAVGPVWEGDAQDARLLRSAYDAALQLADQLECRSVALPLLSAGSFGCPAHTSLSIALAAIEAFLERVDLDVTLVLFDRKAVAAGLDFLGDLESRIDDAYVQENTCYRAAAAPMERAQMAGAFASKSKSRQRFGSRREAADETSRFDSLDNASEMLFEESLEEISEESLLPSDVGLSTMEKVAAPSAFEPASATDSTTALEGLIGHMDEGFSSTLLSLVDASGMTDAQVYRRANMSRQHFSKIRSNAGYRPSKATVLSLCVALELSLAQTRDLLARAGFALSHASKFDIIVEYFIERGIYDQFTINEALFYFDQPLLGG